MSPQYAKDQPASFTNQIKNVAIIGEAAGNVGSEFVSGLLKTGKHTVTALTRTGSKSTFPASVKVAYVNYDDESTLVTAMKGQEFLVITLSISAAPDTQTKLIKAAAKAGVPYIMPNYYGYDIDNPKFGAEMLYGDLPQIFGEIEKLGVSSSIAMVCGFWYEWSLALGTGTCGIDIKNKKAIFFDDGKTIINTSTWIQCGRALARLLSLKTLPEDADDKSPTVSQWKNKGLYISSFRVSQRDMLDNVQRVTGTTDKDWTIEHEPSVERYQNGLAAMKRGERQGFVQAMYTRSFFQTGEADYEGSRGLDNSLLGIPAEDVDEATKRAVEMVESGWNPFAH